MSDGTFSNCTITVTDNKSLSRTLIISPFTIDTTAQTISQVSAVTTPTNDTTPSAQIVAIQTMVQFSYIKIYDTY